MGKYILRCLECDRTIPDRYTNRCENDDAVLRAEYQSKKMGLADLPGIWKFQKWLPIDGISGYKDESVTYKSESLAGELGLKNLYISFSGYFPNIKCRMKTCSFKELEAPPTLQRAKEKKVKKLVVASAGNTARAFAYVSAFHSSQSDAEVVIAVPESSLDSMWVAGEVSKKVRLISVADGCDYSDTIQLAERLCSRKGFTSEGGAKNVARRDGMGTVLLEAALKIRKIPMHYFQAVGSGTGAISAWEAALRLIADGRYGSSPPVLHLSQNAPFTPMANAWRDGRREIVPEKDMPDCKGSVPSLYANVLSNRNPPYAVRGGVYDALTSTAGKMYCVTESDARDAGKLFAELEGVDIVPAACVAVSSLISAVKQKQVGLNDTVLLNITGGGEKMVKEDCNITMLKPSITVKDRNIPIDDIIDALE